MGSRRDFSTLDIRESKLVDQYGIISSAAFPGFITKMMTADWKETTP